VPEAFIGSVRSGGRVEVELGALPSDRFGATVTEVGTAAAGAAGFPVAVRLDEGDIDRVRPGMAAQVTFRTEGRGDGAGVLVPPEAVGQDRRGRFVYVLVRTAGDTATAEYRLVETGALTPEGLEILGGVGGGEYVATAGLRTLVSGQRVRLLGTR